jgi:hypothetical protein
MANIRVRAAEATYKIGKDAGGHDGLCKSTYCWKDFSNYGMLLVLLK